MRGAFAAAPSCGTSAAAAGGAAAAAAGFVNAMRGIDGRLFGDGARFGGDDAWGARAAATGAGGGGGGGCSISSGSSRGALRRDFEGDVGPPWWLHMRTMSAMVTRFLDASSGNSLMRKMWYGMRRSAAWRLHFVKSSSASLSVKNLSMRSHSLQSLAKREASNSLTLPLEKPA